MIHLIDWSGVRRRLAAAAHKILSLCGLDGVQNGVQLIHFLIGIWVFAEFHWSLVLRLVGVLWLFDTIGCATIWRVHWRVFRVVSVERNAVEGVSSSQAHSGWNGRLIYRTDFVFQHRGCVHCRWLIFDSVEKSIVRHYSLLSVQMDHGCLHWTTVTAAPKLVPRHLLLINCRVVGKINELIGF